MSGLFVLVFWIWLGISVLIYVRRLSTTGSLRSVAKDGGGSDPSDRSGSTAADTSRRKGGAKTARLTIDEELAVMAPPLMAPEIPVTAKQTVADAEAVTIEAATSPADPVASGVATRTEDAPLARSLADALAGIRMPCELAPLTTTARLDPRNMVFTTSGYPAEVVGTSVADELERLGYSFSPVDERTLQARRGGTVVAVTVHPDKEAAVSALGGRAGTAPEDGMAVEFQLR